jgi:cysteine desulfurase
MKRIYLDYAATTPTHPDVLEAMIPYFHENFGNPASIYSYGQEASAAVEEARAGIAGFIGAREGEIVFTGGGTEADNYAIQGAVYSGEKKGNHIITTSIEHAAVINMCKFLQKRGVEVTFLPVDNYGLVDPDDVKNAITDKTVLISVMHASNEIGTIQPIAEIGKIAGEAGIPFHTDAVQTTGHIPVDVTELGADLLSMSAHRFYGPKGIGALYIRKGTKVTPLMHGGEQERWRRPSTHNVPGIVGFGKAVELARQEMDQEAERLTRLRDNFIKNILERIEHTRLNGHPTRRLPNNVNITFDFIEGESMLLNLDLEGICASTASACASSSLSPSHVLLAIGVPPEKAHGSLRFSLGKWTTGEEINHVLDILTRGVARLRAMSPLINSQR